MSVDVLKLRQYADAYGVAVRAGAITPNRDDEAHFRKMFELPKMSSDVLRQWESTDGVRAPITLAQEVETVAPLQPAPTQEKPDDEPKDT